MGTIIHTTIVVTGAPSDWRDRSKPAPLREAHTKARELLGELVSEIVPHRVNGLASFFVAPDGSKRGWADANEADVQRAELIRSLYGLQVEWFSVRSGSDLEGPFYVTRFSREA